MRGSQVSVPRSATIAIRVSCTANCASAAQTRRSAAQARSRPPPRQKPLTAATTGLGQVRTASIAAWKRLMTACSNAARCAAESPGRGGGRRSRDSSLSRPMLKARPSAQTTTARIWSLAAMRPNTSERASKKAGVIAFSRPGLDSTTSATGASTKRRAGSDPGIMRRQLPRQRRRGGPASKPQPSGARRSRPRGERASQRGPCRSPKR